MTKIQTYPNVTVVYPSQIELHTDNMAKNKLPSQKTLWGKQKLVTLQDTKYEGSSQIATLSLTGSEKPIFHWEVVGSSARFYYEVQTGRERCKRLSVDSADLYVFEIDLISTDGKFKKDGKPDYAVTAANGAVLFILAPAD